MKKILLLIALALSAIALNAGAATLVETQHRKGLSRIYSENAKGRMELPGSDRYLIVDSDQKTLYFVKPSKQEVLDLSFFMGQLGKPSAEQATRTALIHKGPGPSLAGYETIRFDYAPQQELCGSVFASKSALNDSGLKHLFGLLQEAASKLESFATLFRGKTDVCQGAEEFIAADIGQHGLPMRIVDKNGAPWSQVIGIKKDSALPANAFTYPKSYKVKDIVRIRERVQKKIQQHFPQINQLLNQLQSPGAAAAGTGGQ